MKPYEEFRKAIAERESAGNAGCVNFAGYLGKYQFGMARLCDLGVTRRLNGTKGFSNANFQFISPMSKAKFLADPCFQDYCFDKHVADLKRQVLKACPEETNLSGAIAACHLLGPGNYVKYQRDGLITHDELGTSIDEYYTRFSGYEILV